MNAELSITHLLPASKYAPSRFIVLENPRVSREQACGYTSPSAAAVHNDLFILPIFDVITCID
jgi:hypothetical protein